MYVHIVGHILVSVLFSFIALGNSPQGMYLAFLAGAILVDLDHVIYVVFAQRTLSPKKIKKYLEGEYKTHTPHIYIFHTIEILIGLYLFAVLFVTNAPVFYVLTAFVYGMELHLLIDFVSYLWIKRSFRGWLRHFSLFGMFLSRH